MSLISYRDIDSKNERAVLDALAVDGHGRLEGAYFETFTISKLLAPLFGDGLSTGWWFASASEGEYLLFKLFTGTLTSLETDFISLILNKAPTVKPFLVKYEIKEKGIRFLARAATRGNPENYIDAERLLSQLAKQERNERVIKKPPVPANPGRSDEERLEKALEYIADEVEIQNLLAERMFANQILNKYYKFIYDLDAVAHYRDQPIGFELKRKYPEPATEFGINKGLVNFFLEIIKVVDVYHLILNSACWNKKTSPFLMFEREDIKQNTVWVGAKLTSDLLNNAVNEAQVQARDFGIGDTSKRTPKFSVKEFSFVSKLVSPDTSMLESLLLDDSSKIAKNFLSNLRQTPC